MNRLYREPNCFRVWYGKRMAEAYRKYFKGRSQEEGSHLALAADDEVGFCCWDFIFRDDAPWDDKSVFAYMRRACWPRDVLVKAWREYLAWKKKIEDSERSVLDASGGTRIH